MGAMPDPGDLLERLVAAGRLPPEALEAWRRAKGDATDLAAFLESRLPPAAGRDAVLASLREALGAPGDSDGRIGSTPSAGVGTVGPAESVPPVARATDRNRRLRLAAAVLGTGAALLWLWESRAQERESSRRGAIADLMRGATASEQEGKLEEALSQWRELLRLQPDHPEARAGRSRARDTLLFAGAMKDALAASEAGAREMAAGHARVAESIWPGHPVIRDVLAQARGLARLHVESPAPCRLFLRPLTGGDSRAIDCPGAVTEALPPGDYDLVITSGRTVLRRLTLRCPDGGEARLSLASVPVAPDGDGAGLQAAVDRALPGTTLVLAPGTYREAVRVRTSHLRLEARESGRTVIRAPAPDQACLEVDGAEEVAVHGLALEDGAVGLLAGPGSGLSMTECRAQRNQVGVLLVDRENVRIEGCELLENREAGLQGRARRVRILNGRFADNRGAGLQLEDSEDVTVASNVFARNRRLGVGLHRGTRRVRVFDNVVHTSDRGILADAAPCEIRHNTVTDFRDVGIEATHRGEQGELRILDNVISHGTGVGLHLREEQAMGAALSSDHNALSGNAVLARWTSGRRTETFATLDEWRRRTDLDRRSTDADPGFQPAAGDAPPGRLSAASPCRGAGSDGLDVGAQFDGDRPRAAPVEPLTLPEWGERLRGGRD